MEAEIFPDAWSEKALTETWEQKTSVMITARKDGELIGYLIVYLVEGEGEIARIAVKQEKRRRGCRPYAAGAGKYL
ncbi:MAG: GNAT family N-acetyltransferase [[Clostridium] scindens]